MKTVDISPTKTNQLLEIDQRIAISGHRGHNWGTTGAQLGHNWGTTGAQLGHNWGTGEATAQDKDVERMARKFKLDDHVTSRLMELKAQKGAGEIDG